MIEKKPQPHDGTDDFSVRLSPTRRGARLARLLAAAWMRSQGLPDQVVEPAEHLVAELAANAATHGRLPGRDFLLVVKEEAEVLRIEVTDARGEDLPSPRLPAEGAESGRGLLLVAALADRWGLVAGPVPRKTVWAELDLLPGTFAPPEPQPCVRPATSSSAAR